MNRTSMRAPGHRAILPLLLTLALSQAYAAPVERGTDGANGIAGTAPGQPGGQGSDGGAARAIAGAADAAATAVGGSGGNGGAAADSLPGQVGARGGKGGNGGNAEALHLIRSTGGAVTAKADATGGLGGLGGPGGNWFTDLEGPRGDAGKGGDSHAAVDIAGIGAVTGRAFSSGGTGSYGGSGGNASVALTGKGDSVVLAGRAVGGSANEPYRRSTSAGHGGTAGGAITASAGAGGINASLQLTGGNGTSSWNELALGGNGGDVIARDPFAVATTGDLTLTLAGTGGNAGVAQPLTSVRAGQADLEFAIAGGQARSVNVTAKAVGGVGGGAMNPGRNTSEGGLGRSVVKVDGIGPVTVTAEATGGAGGLGGMLARANGARGGNGIANAAARGNGAGFVTSTAVATGGAGGLGRGAGVRGGEGGGAQGVADGRNTAGGGVWTSLTLHGGAGGNADRGASGGNGASVRAVDLVSGSSAGHVRLSQSAQGGAGGSYLGREADDAGAGGNGGNAFSQMTLTDMQSSQLDASVSAHGGDAGYGYTGPNGRAGGGEALLQLTSTKAGADVTGSAYAVTGHGWDSADARSVARSTVVGARNAVSSAEADLSGNRLGRGSAFASAKADNEAHAGARGNSTFGVGVVDARAESESRYWTSRAAAYGRGAEVNLSALSTSHGGPSMAEVDGSGLQVNALATSVTTSGALSVRTTAEQHAAMDERHFLHIVAATSIRHDRDSGSLAWQGSFASLLPRHPPSLDATPRVAAAFASGELFAEGSMRAGTGVAMTDADLQKRTAAFNFDTTKAGNLTLGLIGFYSATASFGQFEFSVFSHGTELYAHTFDSVAEAQAFFSDQALSLGALAAGRQDILITADYLLSEGGAIEFDYVLGVGALAPIPEPGTWLMVLLGMTVVLVRGRVRQRD